MIGLCECGCGQVTAIAKRRNRGIAKGDPYRFVRGHHARMRGFAKGVTCGNDQARRMYPAPLGLCEECGEVEAVERHHKDGNPQNNVRANIAFVCRRCHMTVDGRAARLAAYAQGRSADAARDYHGRYACEVAA